MGRIKKFQLVFIMALVLSACQPAQPAVQPDIDTANTQSAAESSPVASAAIIKPANLQALHQTASQQPSSGALYCAWSDNGSRVSAMDITWAGLYDAQTLELQAEFTGDEYTALYAVSADAGLAAYSLDGIKIQIYDFASKADRASMTPDFAFGSVFFSPDGSKLAVQSLDAIEIMLYDTTTGSKMGSLSGFDTAAPIFNASFSPDGRYLVWHSRGTAQPMEIAFMRLLPSLSHEDFISDLTMSHDNRLVATAAAGELNGEYQPLVTIWDAAKGQPLFTAGNIEYTASLDFSPQDEVLAAATGYEVTFYDTATGSTLYHFQPGGDLISSLAFSPDGKGLLVCGTDGVVAIWRTD
jgi:WD40 repeat protein